MTSSLTDAMDLDKNYSNDSGMRVVVTEVNETTEQCRPSSSSEIQQLQTVKVIRPKGKSRLLELIN
jgi:hypothetical protein